MFGQPLPHTICAAIVLGNLGRLQVLLGLELVELFSWFDFTFRFCLSAPCAGTGFHPGGWPHLCRVGMDTLLAMALLRKKA